MEKDLIIKYYSDIIDLWAVKNFSRETIFSREYFDKLKAVSELLATKTHELEKVITLDSLRKKLDNKEVLTFDEKTFIRNNMKLVQFLGADDLAGAVGLSFYGENGHIEY